MTDRARLEIGKTCIVCALAEQAQACAETDPANKIRIGILGTIRLLDSLPEDQSVKALQAMCGRCRQCYESFGVVEHVQPPAPGKVH